MGIITPYVLLFELLFFPEHNILKFFHMDADGFIWFIFMYNLNTDWTFYLYSCLCALLDKCQSFSMEHNWSIVAGYWMFSCANLQSNTKRFSKMIVSVCTLIVGLKRSCYLRTWPDFC